MIFYYTFPISNLTLRPRLGFSQTCFFLQESHLGFFFLILFFPLKNKTKISEDFKSFSKNQAFTKQIKKRVLSSSGNASSEMWGPHYDFDHLKEFKIVVTNYDFKLKVKAKKEFKTVVINCDFKLKVKAIVCDYGLTILEK